MIYKLFKIKNKIPNFIKKIVPKFLRRKINKKLFNFYFIPTTYKKLPEINYINNNNIDYQENLIKMYNNNSCQNSFMTCPHLIQLLLMKFNINKEFSFLDIGGDNIDFFLDLRKKFKNLKYYNHNKKSVNIIFKRLKLNYNYDNLYIIENINEIFYKKYDFVNFGSSIQYFDNYELILDNITNVSKCIMMSGTTLYESNDLKFQKHIIVKQVNLNPDINYLYFFNKKNFYNFFLTKNFKLAFESLNLTDNINYKNFNNLFSKVAYTDFLFEKI